VFLGSTKSFDIVMDNQGYGRISSMTAVGSYVISGAGASQFLIETSPSKPSSIAARDQGIVRVSFKPTAAGVANATLTITGKSGTNVLYTYTVSLFGVGAETSKIALTPESQVKTPLAIGQTVTADVTVQNTGAYPLKYFIPGFDTKGVSDNWPSAYHKYGYKFRTNYATDANPIAYSFQDIKTTGVDITSSLMSDRVYYTLDMGFDFPYYDKVMNTIYIAQKGFTTFDNTVNPLNTPPLTLGQQSRPRGYISPLGTFLTFAVKGKVFYKKEADRLIIQYDDVHDGSSTGTITAQMVLFSNGDIRFYYQTMGYTTSNQRYLNILIEDVDKKDGIIVHNFYKIMSIPNGTAFGFDYPGPNIITGITNGSGVIAPGGSANVSVTMNTATLVEGVTNRYINFISNDPTNNGQKNALIELDVTSGGTAYPAISTNTIAFGDVFEGAIRSQVVVVKDTGTAAVNITSMAFTNGKFTLTGEAAPLSVKPGMYKEFAVVIPTGTIATLEDDLVITYADASTYTIHVTGNVVPAPAVNSDLTAVNQTLNYRETASVPYSIENTGAAPLEVSVIGKQWVTYEATGSTPTSVTYDVEKLNKGEVYQWIDITKTGVQVDMSGDLFTPEGFWSQIDLPFPFEFYGVTYDKIQLGQNGVASFDNEPPVMLFSDKIPSTIYDGTYIMPYWTFGATDAYYEGAGVFYQNYDDKIIITWSHLGNFFGGMGDPMSAQMFLYKNGTIKFQYRVENLGEGGDQTSNVTLIGVQQNSTKGVSISAKNQLDYGTSTGLAYILTPEKKHSVAVGATLTGNINFNSHNVYGGTYDANLKIKTNVPNLELQEKPVQLTVNGTPVYEAPDSLKYGSLMIGNPTFNYVEFVIKNTGSAPLTISNMKKETGGNTQRMTFMMWAYAYSPFPPVGWNWQWVDATSAGNFPVTVGANEVLKMKVEHNPNTAQNYNEGLIVTNNSRLDTIRFTSTAYRAPGLVVTTTPINESMNTLTEVVNHKIPFSTTNTNNGQGNLNYSVAIEFGRVTTSSVEEPSAVAPSSLTNSLRKSDAAGNAASVSSTNSYNRTISYTDKTVPDTWVGTGGSSPFVVATKYFSGPEGFSLSHVETFIRTQSLTSGKISVEIRAGGTSPSTATKVTEGSYSFTASGDDDYGSWITIPMDKVGGIYPNENFYVIVTTPLGIEFPQGTITDLTTTGGRYYYYDYESSQWYDINTLNGFQTLGWLMLAAEETAGVTSWLNITSALNGSNAPGVNDTIRFTMDSHYAMRGDQIANIVLTTNDPLKKVTKIPVSLHVNEAPRFGEVPEMVYVDEHGVGSVNIAVSDHEGNTFTVIPAQTYPWLTHTFADGQLTVTLSPDYGDEGSYQYTFTATDEYGASRDMVLSAEVMHTNRAPEYIGSSDLLAYTANGEVFEYSISDLFADPDDDMYTYTVNSLDAAVVQVYTSGSNFIVRPLTIGETALSFVVTDSYGAAVTHTIDVAVAEVLGIEDNDINFSLTAYPNPSKGKVNIHIEGEIAHEYQVRVINNMGAVLFIEKNISTLQDGQVDLSHLQKGIYFIEITDLKGRSTRKFIKE
jgi:hypothetical protein